MLQNYHWFYDVTRQQETLLKVNNRCVRMISQICQIGLGGIIVVIIIVIIIIIIITIEFFFSSTVFPVSNKS